MRNFNFCKNKMRLDKVTCYIQPFSVRFFKLFTTVAIIFHSITFIESTSLDVACSLICKQSVIVCYFMYKHIYSLCVGMFFGDTVHQSATVNYKISLDKIVDIFPNKNIYFCRGNIVKLCFHVSTFTKVCISVFLNAIYLLC